MQNAKLQQAREYIRAHQPAIKAGWEVNIARFRDDNPYFPRFDLGNEVQVFLNIILQLYAIESDQELRAWVRSAFRGTSYTMLVFCLSWLLYQGLMSTEY